MTAGGLDVVAVVRACFFALPPFAAAADFERTDLFAGMVAATLLPVRDLAAAGFAPARVRGAFAVGDVAVADFGAPGLVFLLLMGEIRERCPRTQT
jgi:hypothetical protein